ncbi:MAG: MmgE/PrpD family protein [Streptomycetales bacterium]
MTDQQWAGPAATTGSADALRWGVTRELSEFIAGLDTADIPLDVAHQAKRCLIDWLGVTLAGSAHPSAEILSAVSGAFGAGLGKLSAPPAG